MHIKNAYTYEKKKIQGSYCHIFEFSTPDFRIDVSGILKNGFMRASSIGEKDIYSDIPIVKISAGSLALLQNELVDDKSYINYPSAIIWKNNSISLVDPNVDISPYRDISTAILKCDAILINNGNDNIIYPTEKYDTNPDNMTFKRLNKKSHRTVIGQTQNTTIICVIEPGGFFNKGFNVYQCLELMKSFNCKTSFIVKDGQQSLLLYNNEIMTEDKTELRISPTFLVYGDEYSKKINNIICCGRTVGPIRYFQGDKIIIIPSGEIVEILDIKHGGYHLIHYNDEELCIHGSQLKII